MPIYEFVCSCGYKFEKLCKMGDDSSALCPQCGGEGRKVFSAFRMGRSSTDPVGSSPASGCSTCGSSSCTPCG